MKHTLLIALLGATITLTAPSLSFADNGYKFKSDALERNHNHKHKHGTRHHHKNDKKRFVTKPPKPHRVIKQIHKNKHKNRHNNRQFTKNKHGYNKHGFNKQGYNRYGYNKHGYNKHGHNKHYNKRRNKPEFSISWNVGDSTVSYGNNDNYGYNNGYNNSYNHGYNKGHRKNRGKRIYKRIHKQANRIQHGINNSQLVKREVRKLRHEQREIKNTLSYYKQDGHLDRYERKELNHLLNIASDKIHRKSNNRLTRYSRHNNHYVQY